MRDLRVVEGERAEGGGECIFVTPARTALGDESVEELGAVIIVVSAEAKGLRKRVSSVPSPTEERVRLPSNDVSYPRAFDPNRLW